MNFNPTQRKIMALSAAVARLNQPAWASVLQHIYQNRLGQQEMNHEEEGRARTVGTRSLGRSPGWNTRSRTALMVRLLVVLLPDWVRLVLWRALRERYKEEAVGKGKEPPADEPLFAPTG